MRSMIISAKVLTESPYRVDIGDGDAALQPSDMTVGTWLFVGHPWRPTPR